MPGEIGLSEPPAAPWLPVPPLAGAGLPLLVLYDGMFSSAAPSSFLLPVYAALKAEQRHWGALLLLRRLLLNVMFAFPVLVGGEWRFAACARI